MGLSSILDKIGSGFEGFGKLLGKGATALVKGPQPQLTHQQTQAASTYGASSAAPTAQMALFNQYAPPALRDIAKQLPSDQQNQLVQAFAQQLQSPGGAGNLMAFDNSFGNLSADAAFKVLATPDDLNIYKQLPIDQKRLMEANTLMGALSTGGGNAPVSGSAPVDSSMATAEFNQWAPAALKEATSKLPPAQQTLIVQAFAQQLQTADGAANLSSASAAWGSQSSSSVFNSLASPAMLDVYKDLPPARQQTMQAQALLQSLTHGGAPFPDPSSQQQLKPVPLAPVEVPKGSLIA